MRPIVVAPATAARRGTVTVASLFATPRRDGRWQPLCKAAKCSKVKRSRSYKILSSFDGFTVLPVTSQLVVSASMSAISCVSDLTGIVISAMGSTPAVFVN